MKRRVLALYFRYFLALTRYSAFMAERAATSRPWRLAFRAIQRALSPFYSGALLSLDEALALARASGGAQRAGCICGIATGRASRGASYYLGEWGALYAAHGPCPSTPLGPEQLEEELAQAARRDRRSLMTVSQAIPCAFFPARYVVCACDEDGCLPARYQRLFPGLEIRARRPPAASAPGALLAHLCLALAVPLFAGTFALHRLAEGARWRRVAAWALVLLLLALSSGALISRPGMWPFMHHPAWEGNRLWWLLLPPGVLLEAATVGALLWALLAGLGRRLTAGELVDAVLPAFVAFQGVHLVRFLVTDAVRDRWAFSTARTLFWSFDPLAWGVLAWALYRLARRPRGLTPASPAPDGRGCSRGSP